MGDHVSVSREIAASPETLYAMVADLPRMGEWSPENQGGRWLDGAAEASPGARFRGRNRHGWHSWSTLVTVVDAEPGRRFAFRVDLGPVPISQWTYELEAVPAGCRVTESWADRRPRWFVPIAALATGVGDRTPYTRDGMAQTLERLAAAAE